MRRHAGLLTFCPLRRDREEHLRMFVYHMHPVLQRQQLDYGIFIVEQEGECVTNVPKPGHGVPQTLVTVPLRPWTVDTARSHRSDPAASVRFTAAGVGSAGRGTVTWVG